MSRLTVNWISILFATGALLLLRRGHGYSGLGGMLGGHGHHGGCRDYGEPDATQGDQPRAEATIDPVSGNVARIEDALTSAFRGPFNHFQSRDIRVQFEAYPAQYIGAASEEALGNEHAAGHRPRRGHGCHGACYQ